MPFITRNGKPVWITPQRDTKLFKKNEYEDTIMGNKIPDYILYGKDDKKFNYSTLEESKRAEKEFRDRQKRQLQSQIMRDELDQIKNAHSIYLDTYLQHAKKMEQLQSELSLNKKHEFYGGGKVWRKNRESKLERERENKKLLLEKLNDMEKKESLYY